MRLRGVTPSHDPELVPHLRVVAPLVRLLMECVPRGRPATWRIQLDTLEHPAAPVVCGRVEQIEPDPRYVVLDVTPEACAAGEERRLTHDRERLILVDEHLIEAVRQIDEVAVRLTSPDTRPAKLRHPDIHRVARVLHRVARRATAERGILGGTICR